MNKVQLIYNPYQEKSRILINKKSISEYSRLANYLQERFEIWAPVILECIAQEINDEFELEISSDIFHSWILKEEAEKCEDCISVSIKTFLLNSSGFERFEKIKRFEVKKSDEPDIRVLIFAKDRMLEAFIFGELCKTGSYKMQQSVLSLCDGKIECIITSDRSLLQDKKFVMAVCVGKETDDIFEIVRYLDMQAENLLLAAVKIGEALNFKRLENNCYYFESNEQHFSELIKNMIEFLATSVYIKQKKDEMENSDFENRIMSKQEQLDYLLIDAVEPLIMAYCDSEVEEGKNINLEITAFPENVNLPEVSVKIANPAILSYSDGKLFGLLDGETDIEVTVSGSVKPIYRNHIKVKRIIRITNLYVEDSSVVLKEGTVYEIGYRYEPQDADNIDKIEWSSTNNNVACMTSDGVIKCIGEGTCEIVVQAEKVREKCRVCVKPEMKRIILPNKQIKLVMGQQISFMPDYEPKNCFDSRIFVEVDNSEIVVWNGGKLISRGLGTAQVTFYDAEKRIKTPVEVMVESTLYAAEKSNVYKILSFIIAVISIFLLMINKIYGIIGTLLGILAGIMAVVKDNQNVEGVVNVRGEPMKPDCFASILFIFINLFIGLIAFM